jgi:hypothetical protein
MRLKRGAFQAGTSTPRGLTRMGRGGLHDHKVVAVPTFEWLARDGQGMSRCTRCNTRFESTALGLRTHIRTQRHQKGEP